MRIFGIFLALALFAAVPQASAGTLGCLLGAAAGGFGGAQIGKGNGQLAAVAAGTLLGCGAGSSIQNSDQRRYQPQYQRPYQPRYQPYYGQRNGYMNYSYDRRRVIYSQPRPRYLPQPVYRSRYQPEQWQPQRQLQQACREFQTEVNIGGRLQPAYGRACYQPDGSWRIVSWRQ
ncbi:hypothetical protein LCGC14_0890810 [marine sediment metagenome]|uniref:Glycine zipper 2TM domain-containing protein n=1 Tax=marine sediment metagenome TaxID=412755 RepID=A0A0F9RIM9_9ZZZZ